MRARPVWNSESMDNPVSPDPTGRPQREARPVGVLLNAATLDAARDATRTGSRALDWCFVSAATESKVLTEAVYHTINEAVRRGPVHS